MQQEVALGLVEAFLVANGLDGPQEGTQTEVALEEMPDFRAGDLWDPELQFRFFPETGELKWYALIYDFPDPPSERLLEVCQEEAQSGTADMGGGALEYDSEQQSLQLVRTYQEPVPVEQLSADLMALQQASHLWGDEVLDRAIARAQGH